MSDGGVGLARKWALKVSGRGADAAEGPYSPQTGVGAARN